MEPVAPTLPSPQAVGTQGRSVDLLTVIPPVLVCLVALVVRLYVGSREFMDFDEWQQVFMSAAPRWQDFTFEVNAEAHPPLFFLLLRALLALGHSKLWYRFISIASGTGSVFLMWWIGRKVFRSPAVSVLGAGVLALSASAITISIEVRQYQLLVFLLLLAFSFYLEIAGDWRDDGPLPIRSCVLFSTVSAVAVSCHYSAIVFLGACFLVSIALWRRRFLHAALSLVLPLGVFCYLYFTHGRYRPLEGYLYDFYWRLTPGEALPDFLMRNLQNFWNLFSPIEIRNRSVFFLVFTIFCALCALVLFVRRGRERVGALCPDITVALALVMTLEMLVLSIARKYPFGGLLRHQYVAGPFLLLAVLVVVDRLVSTLSQRSGYALLGSLGVLTLANAAAASPHMIAMPDTVLYSQEIGAFRSIFPNPEAVYLDHWGVIAYYIHTDERQRRFVRRIAGGGPIDEYHVEGIRRMDPGVEIFYDKGRSTLDMSDPAVYRSFADCLRQTGIKELTLFMFHPGYIPFPDAPDVMKQRILKEASAQGLSISKIAVDKTTVFAGFVLK
jgi:hypothetical protein